MAVESCTHAQWGFIPFMLVPSFHLPIGVVLVLGDISILTRGNPCFHSLWGTRLRIVYIKKGLELLRKKLDHDHVSHLVLRWPPLRIRPFLHPFRCRGRSVSPLPVPAMTWPYGAPPGSSPCLGFHLAVVVGLSVAEWGRGSSSTLRWVPLTNTYIPC